MTENPRVYLGARYERFDEVLGYSQELQMMGFRVEAAWLKGMHKKDPTQFDANTHELHSTSQTPLEWAHECVVTDRSDIVHADYVIIFTDPPGTPLRGGHHVELGMALAMRKDIIVVGHRTLVFHHYKEIHFYPTWDEARNFMASIARSHSKPCLNCQNKVGPGDSHACHVETYGPDGKLVIDLKFSRGTLPVKRSEP